MSIWIDKWQFTKGVVIIYEEGGGGVCNHLHVGLKI
jgi:hypothetical protein